MAPPPPPPPPPPPQTTITGYFDSNLDHCHYFGSGWVSSPVKSVCGYPSRPHGAHAAGGRPRRVARNV
ncbi:hypothetical protein ACI65C_008590 [Semiaphis heraclei]